jgi:hypothetical protein
MKFRELIALPLDLSRLFLRSLVARLAGVHRLFLKDLHLGLTEHELHLAASAIDTDAAGNETSIDFEEMAEWLTKMELWDPEAVEEKRRNKAKRAQHIVVRRRV